MRKNLFRIMVLSLLVFGLSGIGYANLTDEPLYGDANDVSDINGSGCIPDNPNCEKTTCKGCWCDNGCVRIEGTREGCGPCGGGGDSVCDGDHAKQVQLGGVVLGSQYLGISFGYLCKYSEGTLTSHPELPYFHAGVDFTASPGTTVMAAQSGTISPCSTNDCTMLIPDNPVNGNSVRIFYLHIVPTTSGKVSAGDPIAKVLNMSGPHLHIEARKNYSGTYAVGSNTPCPDGLCDTKSDIADLTVDPGELSQSPPTPTSPPTPKIQANGQDGPITVTENTPVSVTVSLAPGDQNEKNADWWAAMFYSTWFSLTPYNTWALGLNPWAQKPLYSFSPVEIYNSTVSVGENIFCFGVDMSPNGILDSPLYADCVYVNGVTSTPMPNVKYEVVNSLSGKCIDVAGDPGKDNGSKIQIWDRQFSSDQKWEITKEGFIKNLLSGKCIDVDGAPGKDNGSKLQLWDCEVSGYNADNNSPTDQKWFWIPLTMIPK